MFNLNFNLREAPELEKTFLRVLYNTYKDPKIVGSKEGIHEKTARKIIAIVASASSLEGNHFSILKSGFYKQFKHNINMKYTQLQEQDEEVELFGLVNLVLSKKHMQLIYKDLRKVHKIAMKNDKIGFKTKVDLLSELSKFIA